MKWLTFLSHVIGRSEIFGIDLGFWAGMAVVVFIVLLMNLVAWSQKPKEP